MRNNLNAISIKKEQILMLAILIAVAVAAPLLFRQQLVTGTIVNATLIIGVSLLGIRDGLLIGLIPSSFALATGLLPSFMAPMIPFIIIGNAVLVLTFAYLNRFNYWLGIAAGSILKAAFLYGAGILVTSLIMNQQLTSAVAQMMGWTQLFTAVAGGVVAFGIVKILKNQNLFLKI